MYSCIHLFLGIHLGHLTFEGETTRCLEIWGTEYTVMPHHIAEKWMLHPSCWENLETCMHVVNVLLQPYKRACTCLFLACQRVVCAVASGLENLLFSGPVVLVGPSGHLLPSPYLWLRLTMPVFHCLLLPVSL